MFPLVLGLPRNRILDKNLSERSLHMIWSQVGQWGMGECDKEWKKANAGYGNPQITAVGKQDPVLLGISGRLNEHALGMPWSMYKA